eukprot:3936074-Rhodomonas_salina.1
MDTMFRRHCDATVFDCADDITVRNAREQRSNNVCAVSSNDCNAFQTDSTVFSVISFLLSSARKESPTL